jgi:hypothetical protein
MVAVERLLRDGDREGPDGGDVRVGRVGVELAVDWDTPAGDTHAGVYIPTATPPPG